MPPVPGSAVGHGGRSAGLPPVASGPATDILLHPAMARPCGHRRRWSRKRCVRPGAPPGKPPAPPKRLKANRFEMGEPAEALGLSFCVLRIRLA